MEFVSNWIFPELATDEVQQLARALSISYPVAAVLWRRGYKNESSARLHLNPSLDNLHPPTAMKDMDAAVARILRAISRQERILLYGDYDVDGITSVTILASALRMLGADPHYHVPHRLLDGYGIHAGIVEREAALGTKLIISVDTGIRASDEVELATRLGIDMVITDHHLPEAVLPPALAVLNPNRADGGYPEQVLCGAGVTLKLVQALFQATGWTAEKQRRMTLSLMKLAAIGTIADVVPLTGENRILVWHGLRGLADTRSPGLSALLQAGGLKPGETPTAGQIAFRIAPRVNAAGRMADAREAVEMLLTQDATRAAAVAEQLNQFNTERQAAEQAIIQQIVDRCTACPPTMEQLAMVFHHGDWHRGVVGIVASRIVERYRRPTFVLGIDATTGLAQGSGRSIHGFSLVEALESMPELFERFGGHHMAAGVTLKPQNLSAFAERMNAYAVQRLQPADLIPNLHIDSVLEPEHLCEQTTREVEQLGPFGFANPTPVFALRNVRFTEPPVVFAERHLRLRIRGKGRSCGIRAWGFADRIKEFSMDTPMDLAVTLELDPRSAEKGYPGWAVTLRDLRKSPV